MLFLPSLLFLFLSICSRLVSGSPAARADLKGSLTSLGISASFPGDASYASASTAFNLRFTFSPAAVTFPKSAEQVSQIVKIGDAQGLTVVARSGGHSYIANGLGGKDGALVVDLKNFSKVTVDSSKGTAIIETGNRLGDVARRYPHGVCPYVGIGGHAAHGGFGFSSRMWGLTLDTITAVNTVLANGTITRVTNQNNPDLFWGLRGSASSFGITTSIEVTTFPAPPSATIFQYDWDLNVTAAAKGIAAFQSFVQTDIPSHFGGEINLFRGPTAGTVTFSLTGGWYAPVQGLNATLAPLMRQMPSGPRTTLQTGTYVNSARILAGGSLDTKSKPDGHDTFYAKSLMTPQSAPMSDAAILAFTKYLANQGFASKTEWFVQLELYGGKNSAINAVAPDATAFAHRSSTFTIQFYASAPGKAPPYPSYGFTFMDDMVKTLTSNSPRDWDYGAYPNYVDDKLVDWKQRYYGAHYARLRSLKDKYDPKDLFTFPTAIEE
ncbi:glucooligosaccharide oxidase [Lyophyllum atratum]|nr:glucooligosaccharide oxidase [Lyophyllum atratum]